MEKAFYEAETPEEAIKRYFKANDTLYDKMKNEVIKGILYSLGDFRKSMKVLEVGAGGVFGQSFLLRKGLMLPVLIYMKKF